MNPVIDQLDDPYEVLFQKKNTTTTQPVINTDTTKETTTLSSTNTDTTTDTPTQSATKDTTSKIKNKSYYDEYETRDRLDLVDIMD